MQTTTTETGWLTLREVASRLRLHMSTVRKMIDRGEVHGVKVGSQWRISRESIEQLEKGGNATDG
jgi:excisionase family DNA binding protein